MYDFVIIGGGIIGMSTAMQLIDVYPDARIALLEKESGPACHQTGHNSGVIHAGVYYTPGSLKAQFCLAGNRATKAFAIKTAFATTTAARCWLPRPISKWNGCAPYGNAQRRTVSSANGLTPTNCASANRISPGSAAFLCRPAALSATAT